MLILYGGQRETMMRIVSQGGPPVFTDNPRTVSFVAPGLPSLGIDRNGNYNAYFLLRYCRDMRSIGIYMPMNASGNTLMDWEEVSKAGLVFVSACQLDVARVMYDQTVPKAPLNTRVALVTQEARSHVCRVEFALKETKQPLFKLTYRFSFVDRATRKAAPFPKEHLGKFTSRGTDNGPAFRVERFEKPRETFWRWTQVKYLDTDLNKHTNFAAYMMYAINTIQEAVIASQNHRGSNPDDVTTFQAKEISASKSTPAFLKQNSGPANVCGISPETVQIGVKTARIRYFSESRENDWLQVHVWLHEDREVRCSIESQTGKGVCQLSLEYYAPLSKM